MKITVYKSDTNLATLIHLSVFTKCVIPFGNFIFPLILWATKRNEAFIDHHGRNALNFQISVFLYFILVVCLGIAGFILLAADFHYEESFIPAKNLFAISDFSEALPFVILAAILAIVLLALFVLEIFGVVNASIKASNGALYSYPLSIPFISPESDNRNKHSNP